MLRTILIVDDVGGNREILKKILGNEYGIVEAANGRDAMAVLLADHSAISLVLLDLAMPVMDGFEVLEQMRLNAALSQIPVIVTTGKTEEESEVRALRLGACDYVTKPYNTTIIKQRIQNAIDLREGYVAVHSLQSDKLTGLYNREAFFDKATEIIIAHEPGEYVMAAFDIDGFKVINDQYGTEKGNEVLKLVAAVFRDGFSPVGGICGRVTADHFAVLYPRSFMQSKALEEIFRAASIPDATFRPITFSIGRYIVTDLSLTASAMYDRAVLAKASVKGRYNVHIALYDESMRERLIHEQRIVTEMHDALKGGQFEPWFQPQYNHVTGAMVGAEALVRWRHPRDGLLVAPGDFVPVFERNGFIYEVDKYIWESVCILLRKWIDEGRSPLPIAVNISRYDLFCEDFYSVITGLVKKYHLPVELLRLEVTESAFAKSSEQIIAMVRRLLDYGFTVEIDDFGSGYSSLNTLKDVPATILKLDMKFLENTGDSQRGGNILESIVRMAKWLGMSVIAEGVETKEQADFLKSIGCFYVQGYLYAKPMPVKDYEALSQSAQTERKMSALETVETLNNNAFWDPRSMETLIFNSYIGGACILEYHRGKAELLRANDHYLQELGIALSGRESLAEFDPERYLDESNRRVMHQSMRRAIATGKEETCELTLSGLRRGDGTTHIRATIRALAKTGDYSLLYCAISNITAQRLAEQKVRQTADQMQAIMDNVDSGITAAVIEGKNVRMLFANDKYFEILGYTREQYQSEVGDTLTTIHPADLARVLHATEETNRTGRSNRVEYRVIRRDQKEVWVRILISAARMDGVAELVQIGILTDISAEKKAEQELREGSEQIQTLMNDTPGGFCRMKLGKDHTARLLYANDGFCRLVNMPREEVMAAYEDNPLSGLHPDDRAGFLQAYRKAAASSGQIHMKCRVRDGAGQYLWVMIAGRLAKTETGELFMNAYYTDISAQTQIDEQRRELIENLPCGAGIYELSGNTMRATYLNKRYRDYLGREVGELSTAPVMEVVHPEDRARLWEALQAALQQNHEGSCDIRIMDGNGGYIPFHVMGYIVEHKNEKTVIYVTYTPIPREELTLRETLPYILSAMMAFSTDLSFVKDKDLRYICCSRCFAQMVGLGSEHDVVGKTDYDLFAKEIADKYRADDRSLLTGGVSLVDEVELIPSDDGVAHYSSTSKYLLYDMAGNVIGLYGVGRDITEYRAAFEQLKLLTNSIPGGLATYEISPAQWRLLYFSDGYLRNTGLTRAEYLQAAKSDPLCLVYEEDVPVLRAAATAVLEGDASFNYEYRTRDGKGGHCWLNIQGVVVERHGDTAVVNVVKLDITERKQAEERLRMSEEQYRLAQRQSGNIMCRFDVADQSVNMSAEAAAIFDMPQKVLNVPEEPVRLGRIAPESTKAYIGFYKGILQGQETGMAEFLCKTSDGWRWMKGVYSSIFSNDGKPVYAVISFEDTTEQHRQAKEREALLENERALQRQAESDGMTGVYNRAATEAMIAQRLAHGAEKPCSLIIADLDNLKAINDTLGHPQGDRALLMIAQTLKSQFRQSDIVGRIGGDEFVVFLDGVGQRDKLGKMMAALIEKISTLRIGERDDVPVCVSIGVAQKERDETFDELYHHADKALYYAKRNGKRQYAFYSSEIEA